MLLLLLLFLLLVEKKVDSFPFERITETGVCTVRSTVEMCGEIYAIVTFMASVQEKAMIVTTLPLHLPHRRSPQTLTKGSEKE